ncbi:MAG: HIT domain-containing protein, partial [Oscillospiraceae bacterium]
PQAPIHFLVIPKEHISSPSQLTEANSQLIGHIFAVIAKLALQLGLDDGYRVVTNSGKDAGQSVGHLHFHILAKRSLSWPPG